MEDQEIVFELFKEWKILLRVQDKLVRKRNELCGIAVMKDPLAKAYQRLSKRIYEIKLELFGSKYYISC